MHYAISDLHGCYTKYINLLERLRLNDNDTLYILGDIVDRGNGSMEIIKDIIQRQNVITLRGNHNQMAMKLLNNSDNIAFNTWISDGGKSTYDAFQKLNESDKKRIIYFLESTPIFEKKTINGRKFFLSHTVPEKAIFLDFKHCKKSDFLLAEPDYEEVYDENILIVTGHTPTSFIDSTYQGKIWQHNNHIAIDCGTVFGNPLGCICLDNLEEIYV